MMSSFLDQIFKYQSLGNIADPDNEEINTTETHSLNGNLKEFLAKAYFNDQGIDILIKYYEDRDDCSFCKSVVEDYLKPLRDKFFNLGFDRSSLDTSIALIFGNKVINYVLGNPCSSSEVFCVHDTFFVGNIMLICATPSSIPPDSLVGYACDHYSETTCGFPDDHRSGMLLCKRIGRQHCG
mmetsp:Transcript_14026/g.41072  ORF Transcript_14026/g.41072 Transcript_14026/m.41072 type:complete len:182 (+) Transcript_14026:1997-2542(+)